MPRLFLFPAKGVATDPTDTGFTWQYHQSGRLCAPTRSSAEGV
jgi:hypothetical protein